MVHSERDKNPRVRMRRSHTHQLSQMARGKRFVSVFFFWIDTFLMSFGSIGKEGVHTQRVLLAWLYVSCRVANIDTTFLRFR